MLWIRAHFHLVVDAIAIGVTVEEVGQAILIKIGYPFADIRDGIIILVVGGRRECQVDATVAADL